jgi:SAM-dependent methyltransferase
LTTLETTTCDLCGSAHETLYLCVHDRIYGQPGEFQLMRCGHCGLLFINPRPDRASIGIYYPDLDYHAFRSESGLKAAIKSWLRRSEAQSLLQGLPPHAKTLEIGCGTGELLVALRDLGAEVMGIEPNAAAVKSATEGHGLRVELGMLDDVPLAENQFDLILMKYALEHVHSPRETLTQIGKLLKSGGRAVFWIPNAASWDAHLFGERWRGLDAPRHLYIFTPETIKGLIEAAGMELYQIGYSPVPNDWAGSFEFWLRDRHIGFASALGVESLLGLALWAPASATAALFEAAGRMRVTAIRKF